MIFSVIILAVSLSLDALTVGTSYGLRKIKIPFVSKLIICFFSIFYSGTALMLGHSLSYIIPPLVSKLIGVILLVGMGIWIILHSTLENQKDEQELSPAQKEKKVLTLGIKSLGITIQVIKNPVRGDVDKSGVIDTPESLLLGLALSVDAIGAGIGSALAGFNSFIIPFSVGFFQMLFLYAGNFIGERFRSWGKVNSKVFSILPGALLITLAILRIY
ncbi:MAG: sporulation membrane protein YtaF [Bacillota bacterium]|nr:sporulation membrane protein YtaF [Bacillota bacterium]